MPGCPLCPQPGGDHSLEPLPTLDSRINRSPQPEAPLPLFPFIHGKPFTLFSPFLMSWAFKPVCGLCKEVLLIFGCQKSSGSLGWQPGDKGCRLDACSAVAKLCGVCMYLNISEPQYPHLEGRARVSHSRAG